MQDNEVLIRWMESIGKTVTETAKNVGQLTERMETLTGNGQPGIIQRHQDDIDELKSWRDRILGGVGIITFLGGLAEYLIHKK